MPETTDLVSTRAGRVQLAISAAESVAIYGYARGVSPQVVAAIIAVSGVLIQVMVT